MSEKFNQQQLNEMSLDELATVKASAEAKKAELEKKKASSSAWSDSDQDRLDETVEFIVDLEDYIEERSNDSSEHEQKYVVAKNTENMLHLLITRSRRFDQNTGKEISKGYAQQFTFAEWQLFKKSFASLGYTILKVLHDPFGDAAKYEVSNIAKTE